MKRLAPSVVVLLLTGAAAFAQHDPGRNGVRLLAAGEIEKGKAKAQEDAPRMNSATDDAEAHFILALAACLENDPATALEHAKLAVEGGVPFTRFQADPREVFAPLYAHEGFKQWAKGQQQMLLHGPMLGAVTDASARLWVRTADEAKVQVELRPARGAGGAAVTANGATRADRDYTTVVEVKGLKPNTEYAYTVKVDGRPEGKPATFRTFAPRGEAAKFSIAFGGGAGYTPPHERMWTLLADHDPTAMLLLGDNVYIDDPEHALTQRYCYYRRHARPEWREFTASTPIFTIYDDHDFGMNDCVPGPEIDNPPWKRQVWNVYRENWVNPSYGGEEKQPGCWYDFHIGDVHFIMLDCRYYRDLKGGSMIGPVQKKWLFETLKHSKGTFKVLASSVPWSAGVKGGSKDTWDGFPAEREEIFAFLEDNRINGVLLMAADRHRSDLRRTPRPNGYDLYEVMSSRLTNVHTHGLVKNARGSEFILGYNEKCSFGKLTFDTTAADPKITYEIYSIDNEPVGTFDLKLSALSHKAAGGAAATPRHQPNIVLIMADDLGWGDVGFNGNTVIKTPHLDAMAGAGLRFERFYSAAPVCSPTRGSCLTGRHPYRYGIPNANAGHMLPQELTLAELLKEHGYTTGHFGKWHLGTLTKTVKDSNRGGPRGAKHFSPPQDNGFEVCFSTEAKTPTWDPMLRPTQGGGPWWEPVAEGAATQPYGTHYWNEKGEMVTDNLRGDDSRVILDRAIPFMQNAVKNDRPFFAIVWFHAPHLPVVAGPEYAAMYAGHNGYERSYYGCITALDEQVGRLRAELRKLGVADHTLVAFCSDNGPEGQAGSAPGTAGGLRGRKRDLYEGGVRVPSIIEWPAKIKPGAETAIPAVTSDYLPTILDILGVTMADDRPIDGISLLPLFAGALTERPRPIGFQAGRRIALTDNRFKLITTDRGANWALYDLVADRGEKNDLAAARPDVVEKMKATVQAWIKSCQASAAGADY